MFLVIAKSGADDVKEQIVECAGMLVIDVGQKKSRSNGTA